MNPKKILVIDDAPAVYYSVKMCLNGYQVLWGNGGLEGINKFKEEKPDLIFLDLKMADAYGIDVLKVIRQIDQEVPVIIVTAFPGDVVDLYREKLNIHSYMVKPFDVNQIRNKVESILIKED